MHTKFMAHTPPLSSAQTRLASESAVTVLAQPSDSARRLPADARAMADAAKTIAARSAKMTKRSLLIRERPNIQGERREAAAGDVRFFSELDGCLPFAPLCGLAFLFLCFRPSDVSLDGLLNG